MSARRYRLYWYDGYGGLVKVNRGNKGFSYGNIGGAIEKAEKILRHAGDRSWSNRQQIVIVDYGHRYSRIIKIISYDEVE